MGLKMKYFVLKPEGRGAHAKASRAAMEAYAMAMLDDDLELSDALFSWVAEEEHNARD